MDSRSVQSVFAIAVIALLLSFPVTHGMTATQEPSPAKPQPAQSPATPTPIPVEEVPVQATGVSNFLRSLITATSSHDPEIKKIQRQFVEVREQSSRDMATTVHVLEGIPTLEALQTQQMTWHRVQRQTSQWLTWLTARAAQLRESLDYLAQLQETWSKTRDAALAANAPGQVLQAIHTTILALEAARPALQAQNAQVVDLQSALAHEVTTCENILTRIARVQQDSVAGILTRQELPIWSPDLWNNSMAAIRTRIRGTAVVLVESFGHYIRHAPSAWFLQLVIFVVLAILFCAAQRKVARWPTEGKGESPYTAVFDHPYAAAVLIPLLLGSGPLWQASTLVRQAFNALAILPMIRLTRQVIDPKLIPALHALGILFASDTARQTIGGVPLLEQALLLLESSAGIAVVGRFLVQGERHPLHTPSTDGTARSHTPRMLGWLVLLALAGGFLAGVLGYLRLARLLVAGPLIAGFLGIMFYSVVRVLSGLLAFAMHVWPFRRLHMVQHHREFLAHRAHRLLIGTAVVAWVVRVLDYVGLLEPGLSLVGAALFTKLERGSLSISLGDVLAFVLVVWASYLFSALLRFVLREEVYPRTRIGSGLSYAINSLLQYLILTVGFLMGLAALGMDLNKVTVLAGALGVGIGFGLQSVVNNFVSGLILLFERPIHVGDTVEVGNLLGEVRHIGIRASKVRTRQGADIIVPNAQLVGDKVTNWTLGDRLRRIEVPVGMNYGATPSKVIEVLEQVAQAHPMVLRHPPPQALLMGYGDSSINYELRAWTDQFEDWRRIRSDLAVAVYDAVQQQVGMQFPFPQREVRLLRDTPDNDTEKPLPAIDAPVMTDERAQESEGCNGDVCTTNRGRNERKEKP